MRGGMRDESCRVRERHGAAARERARKVGTGQGGPKVARRQALCNACVWAVGMGLGVPGAGCARVASAAARRTCEAAFLTTTLESETLEASPVSRCERTRSSTSGSSSATRSPIRSKQRWLTDLHTARRESTRRGAGRAVSKLARNVVGRTSWELRVVAGWRTNWCRRVALVAPRPPPRLGRPAAASQKTGAAP
jgi:hypothetical protein